MDLDVDRTIRTGGVCRTDTSTVLWWPGSPAGGAVELARRSPVTVQALATSRLAYGYALVGDAKRFHAAHDRARELVEHPTGHQPRWAYYVSPSLCFGDPHGQAVAIRGHEEGLADTLAAKIRASLTYYRGMVGAPGCEVRLHDTTLYNSLFRYDNQVMVNPHIWGQPASANPLLRLQRRDGADWFDRYTESFEAVWNTAHPWVPDPQEQGQRGENPTWGELSITTTRRPPRPTP